MVSVGNGLVLRNFFFFFFKRKIKCSFLRSLYCKELFDGAEGNLVAILEQYPPIGLAYSNLPLKKRIFSQFLHLIGVWFLQKSPIKDVDQVLLFYSYNANQKDNKNVIIKKKNF